MGRRPARRRASLEVDRDSLLELARGGNLYQSPFAFLRELLQNAVDATLLRLFEERGAAAFPTNESSLRDLRALASTLPIDVSITRLADAGDFQRYRVTVDDRGAGIRRSDVPYLQRVASSRKNPQRARLVEAMPEWMRPSGTFGIGLQSAFLVTDEVRIDTRSVDDVASTLFLRASDGGTLELREGRRRATGTRVSVVARIPASLATSVRAHRGGVRPDPLEGSLDPLMESAHAVVRDLGSASIAPVVLGGAAFPSSFDGERAWFDPLELVEVVLPTQDGPGVADHRIPIDLRAPAKLVESWQCYRGALVAHRGGGLLYGLTLATNLHGLTAREALLVGRDDWTARGHAELKRRALAAITRRCPELLAAAGDRSPSLRAWLSAHALRARLPNPGPWWRDIVLGEPPDAPPITLGAAHDAGGITVHSRSRATRALQHTEVQLSVGADGPRATARFVWTVVDAFFPGWTHETAHRVVRTLSPARVTCFAALERMVTEDPQPEGLRILPIPPDLAILRVPDGVLDGLPDDRRCDPKSAMLSPWSFRPDDVVDIENVVEWVAWTAGSGEPIRQKADVTRALIALLRRMDAPLRASPYRRVGYDLDAAIDALTQAYLATGKST